MDSFKCYDTIKIHYGIFVLFLLYMYNNENLYSTILIGFNNKRGYHMKRIISIILVGILCIGSIGAAASFTTKDAEKTIQEKLVFSEPTFTNEN
jgi:hypothetical protein